MVLDDHLPGDSRRQAMTTRFRRSPQERMARAVARMLARDCRWREPRLEVHGCAIDIGDDITITIRGRVLRTVPEPPAEPFQLTADIAEELRAKPPDTGRRERRG